MTRMRLFTILAVLFLSFGQLACEGEKKAETEEKSEKGEKEKEEKADETGEEKADDSA